jgi:hypothetical protein
MNLVSGANMAFLSNRVFDVVSLRTALEVIGCMNWVLRNTFRRQSCDFEIYSYNASVRLIPLH